MNHSRNTFISTGILLIAGAALINVPYTLLNMNFDYPDILRQPPDTILARFHAGGDPLIWTWLAFAWVGLPILAAMPLLHKLLDRPETPWLSIGTMAGVIGGIVQMVGLLRWVFVVPALANITADPVSTPVAKEAAIVAFQVIHQVGGVLLGEHLGQAFTIAWMAVISAAIWQTRALPRWLSILGWAAGAVYLLAQTELLATVMPAMPVVPEAGLVGSLMWLAWMAALGGILIIRRPAPNTP